MPRIFFSLVALVALLGLAGCYAPYGPVQQPSNGYVLQSVQVEPQVRQVVVPAPTYSGEFVSARADVMMRAGPGKSFKGCGHLPKGHTADLLECKGQWCKIRYRGQEGWSYQAYLNFYSNSTEANVVTQQVVDPGYSVNYVVPTQPTYGYSQAPVYHRPGPYSAVPQGYGQQWWEWR